MPRYNGTKVRAVILAQGRRQDWVARRVGVSTALISLVLHGKRTVSADVAQKIADVLQVPLLSAFDLTEGSDYLSPVIDVPLSHAVNDERNAA